MLEKRMTEDAYPLLIRLMCEYGHVQTVIKIEKALKQSYGSIKPEPFTVEFHSSGLMTIRFNDRIDAETKSIFKVKKCPVLSYMTDASKCKHSEPDTYIRYCSLVVAEIEKYKKLESEAEKVINRLESLNRPLTRMVLTEKVL
jgi:hypothetical protein